MEKKIKNQLLIIVNIFIFLMGFVFIYAYLHNDVCTDHDHWYVFQYVKDNYFFDSARYISRILCALFFVYIPEIFNTHINDVSCTVVPFFNASFISLTALFFMKTILLFPNFKNNKECSFKYIFCSKYFTFYYPAIFIICAILPLLSKDDVYLFNSLASTVRYYDCFVIYLFFAIFLYGMIKNFCFGLNKFTFILYIINTFLVGICNEILGITATIICFLFLINTVYSYIKNKTEIKKLCLIFNITSFIILIISNLLQFGSSFIFKNHLPAYSPNMYIPINELSNNIKPFFFDFIKLVFINNGLYLFIISILLVSLFIKRKKNNENKKIIICGLSILCGFLTFLFMICFIDGSKELYQLNSWLFYVPLRTLYAKTLIYLILFLFGCSICLTNSTKKLKITLFIFLYGIVFSYFPEMQREWELQSEITQDLRTILYKADKMSLLYSQLDGITILPISYFEKYSQYKSIFRPVCQDSDKDIRNKMIEISKKLVKNKSTYLFTVNNNITKNSNEYLNYFLNSYDVKLNGVIFVNDDIAFREYYKRLGNFNEKELQKLSFTYLKKNFANKKYQYELNPDLSYTWAAKCKYNYDNGDFKQAVNNCQKAIEINKKEDYKLNHYYYLLGKSYEAIKEFNSAELSYNESIKDIPYSIDVRREIANLYVRENKIENAIEEYNKLLNIYPYYIGRVSGTYCLNIAYLYLKQKNYKKSLEYIKKGKQYSKDKNKYDKTIELLERKINKQTGKIKTVNL